VWHPGFEHQEENASSAQVVGVVAWEMSTIHVHAHIGGEIIDGGVEVLHTLREVLGRQRQADSRWIVKHARDNMNDIRSQGFEGWLGGVILRGVLALISDLAFLVASKGLCVIVRLILASHGLSFEAAWRAGGRGRRGTYILRNLEASLNERKGC